MKHKKTTRPLTA